MRNWVYGDKIIAYCSSDYKLEIIDRKDHSINYSAQLSEEHKCMVRNINDMGDNIGNKITVRNCDVFFITQKKELSKLTVDLEAKQCSFVANAAIENIADVATVGREVYVVSLDGLISNLEHKDNTLKLPCQEDEKFTHMKYVRLNKSSRIVSSLDYVEIENPGIRCSSDASENHLRTFFSFQSSLTKTKHRNMINRFNVIVGVSRERWISVLFFTNKHLIKACERIDVTDGSSSRGSLQTTCSEACTTKTTTS